MRAWKGSSRTPPQTPIEDGRSPSRSPSEPVLLPGCPWGCDLGMPHSSPAQRPLPLCSQSFVCDLSLVRFVISGTVRVSCCCYRKLSFFTQSQEDVRRGCRLQTWLSGTWPACVGEGGLSVGARRSGKRCISGGEEPAVTSHSDVRNVLPRRVLLTLSPLSTELEACSAPSGLARPPAVGSTVPTSSPVTTAESAFPTGVDHRFTKESAAGATANLYHISQCHKCPGVVSGESACVVSVKYQV